MRKTKLEKGITLVALIITIVVLLILAVVSIGAIRDSKIIGHSKDASSEYTIAQEKETLQLALSEWQLQKNNPDITTDFESAIKSALDNTKVEITGEKDGPLNIFFKGTQNKYKVSSDGTITKIDTNSSGSEEKEDVKTLAQLIEPENYGDTIEYSANGVENWKIFYNDGDNVFIITSDCIPYEKIPETVGAEKNENANDAMCWSGIRRDTIDENVSQKFMAQWASAIENEPTENVGGVDVATKLINSSLWTNFINDEISSEDDSKAIGSPTAEMLVASWNQTHNEDLKIECLTYGQVATEMGETDNQKTSIDYLLYPVLRKESGLTPAIGLGKDSLFCIESNYYSSSPGYETEYEGDSLVSYWKLYTGFSGMRCMKIGNRNIEGVGLRPVVCLPANAVANQNEDNTWTNLKVIKK